MNGKGIDISTDIMSQLQQLSGVKKQSRLKGNSNSHANSSRLAQSPNANRQYAVNRPNPSNMRRVPNLPNITLMSSLNVGVSMTSTMNAPTSLANLAQLSGVSLVPVGKNKTLPRDNVSNNQGHSSRFSATIHQVAPQTGSHSLNSRKTVISNVPNAVYQQSLTSQSLAAIPSIRLLNEQISLGYCNTETSNVKSKGSKAKIASNSNSRARKNLTQSVNPTGSQLVPESKTVYGNRVSGFPTPDIGYPELIASSLQPSHSANNHGLHQDLSYGPVTSYEDLQNDVEHESNDLSLLRLMSVLNNPALSLTPVDVARVGGAEQLARVISDSQEKHRHSGESSEQLFNQRESQTSILSFESSYSSTANHSDERSIKKTAKLPKSAVNLIATGTTAPSNNEIQQTFDDIHTDLDSYANQPEVDSRAALDWLSKVALSTLKDVDNPVSLSWVPSTSADVEVQMDQAQLDNDVEQIGELPRQSMSVQLLQQLAAQNSHDDTQSNNELDGIKSPIFESDCIPTMSRVNVQQLDKGARSQEVVYNVCVEQDPSAKPEKESVRGTKDRLYSPRKNQVTPKKSQDLPTLHIEATQMKEVLVSERHLMLEKMVEIAETVGQHKSVQVEPDDIFVNRSKRVMSRIDTVLEKKKRKRFERICDRSSRDTEDGEQTEVSDDDSIIEENADLVDSVVVPIQLPLEEVVTNEKREYLAKVGLISRADKNKLSIEQCEKRLKTVSALALQETEVVSEDMERFVNTIVQTGGTDVQLRTETNIKRNELPLIEGLNRNSSRVKMSYMGALGLDKRSKRTTLYKVAKPQEKNNVVASSQPLQQQTQNDLVKKQQIKTPFNNLLANISTSRDMHITKPETIVDKNRARVEESKLANRVQIPKTSCREAIQVPKEEYMRSLGLKAF